jgi:hypothetical protein
VKRFFLNGPSGGGAGSESKAEAILVMSLKRELDVALKEVVSKEVELGNIKKCFKITKFKEIEEERKAYMQECQRLGKIVRDLKNADKIRRLVHKQGH